MTSNELQLEIAENGAAFEIIAPSARSSARLSVRFQDASAEAFADIQNMAIAFALGSGRHAVLSTESGRIALVLSSEDRAGRVFRLGLAGASAIEKNGNAARILLPKTTGGTLVMEAAHVRDMQIEGDVLTLLSDSADCSLRFRWETPVGNDVREMTAQTAMNIPAGRRAPEWTIGIYDDVNYSRPRASRFGVPMISTIPQVPLGGDQALTPEEAEYLRLGQIPPSRTLYFRCVSSDPIPTTLVPELLIFLPEGLDTTAPPVQVPLTSSSTTEFRGSYTFYQEDTVNWVDGFATLSVYVPLVVQIDLPLRARAGHTAVGEILTPLMSIAPSAATQDQRLFAAKVLVEFATTLAQQSLNKSTAAPEADTDETTETEG